MLPLKGWEIVIVLVVVLLLFGPKNLPKLGSAVGSTIKNLREGMGGDEKKEAEKAEEVAAEAEVESTDSSEDKA